MRFQEGPAFGAIIIGCGLAYFLYHSGKPLGFSIMGGVVVGIADYVLIIWLKNRGINQ